MNGLLKHHWHWIIGIGLVYLYPFYCILIGMIPGVNWPPLLTFGLSLKDFMTVWIALGGVVAVVIGIFQTQRRITQQSDQFKSQLMSQQKQQCDARFASGVELLGNYYESTRLGGVHILHSLSREYEEYRSLVCNVLCSHIRTIANSDKFKTEEERRKYPKNEIQEIVSILLLSDTFSSLQKKLSHIYLDGIFLLVAGRYGKSIDNIEFSYSIFKNVHFDGSQLSNVNFIETIFERVDFMSAQLSNTRFWGGSINKGNFVHAKLHNVLFASTKLKDIDFWVAELSHVQFSGGSIPTEKVIVKWEDKYADLDGVGTSLENISFLQTKFGEGVRFDGAKLINVDFQAAKFNGNGGVNLRGTPLAKLNKSELSMSGVTLQLTRSQAKSQ